jgi:DNA-binding winged helix-turn-helix (wHTH) protein
LPPGSTIYAFGECELDEAQHELRLRGRAQLVPPRVFAAMLHLIRNRARAVSRDELVEVVWGGLAVSDAALSQTIMLARKVTQDEGDQQRIDPTDQSPSGVCTGDPCATDAAD